MPVPLKKFVAVGVISFMTFLVLSEIRSSQGSCPQLWDKLLELSFQNLILSPHRVLPLPSGIGCKTPPKEFTSVHDVYLRSCSFLTLSKQYRPSSNEWKPCFFATMDYRAKIIDWKTSGIPLSEIKDRRILALKLWPKFFGAQENGKSQSAIIEIAERILDRDPSLKEAALMILEARLSMIETARLETKGSPIELESLWKEAEKDLKRVEFMAPVTSTLQEIGLYIRSRGLKARLLESEARQFIKVYPTYGTGYYFMAYVKWLQGKSTEAEALISKAIEREPTSVKFKETLSDIKFRNDGGFRFAIGSEQTLIDFLKRFD